MNYYKILLIITLLSFLKIDSKSQTNSSLSVTGGTVAQNGVLDVLITVSNTGSNNIPVNKVRPKLSVTASIGLPVANALQTGLPAGWIIIANGSVPGVIEICNGTDIIPPGVTRSFSIKVEGHTIGTGSLNGSTSFGPGTGVCTGLGSLSGDNAIDNLSSSTFTVTSSLPLKLLSFNSTTNNCIPTLQWSTTNEANINKFELERTTINNPNGWAKVAETYPQINNNAVKKYITTDLTTIDNTLKYLYRLKIVENDLSFQYSKTLIINTNCNKAAISIYPNPIVNGNLNISINGFSNKAFAVLKTSTGQIIYSKNISNGNSTILVNHVPTGNYVLTVSDETGIIKHNKIIISN